MPCKEGTKNSADPHLVNARFELFRNLPRPANPENFLAGNESLLGSVTPTSRSPHHRVTSPSFRDHFPSGVNP